MPELEIPEKLLPLVEKKKRFKIVIGGRGSGKSNTIADICLMDSQTKRLKIGCFREFQNSIDDSVHSLLKDEIERLGLQGFNTQNNKIYNNAGGEFKFRGLARNSDSMKSMHGFMRFWVEEAQTISDESLKLLTPTLRIDESEIWMSANPMSSADPFSQRFIKPFERELTSKGYYEDNLHIIIVCNYLDNPFFPDVLEQDRLFDKENLTENEYQHIWEGKFNDSIENSIIPVSWFNASIDAHLIKGFKPLGAKIVTHDPSDLGEDPKGLCLRHGSVIIDVLEKTDGDVNDGADWATDYAIDQRADLFRWDCDGLGVTLRRQIATSLKNKRIDFDMFKGSEGVDEPDDYYLAENEYDEDRAKTNKQTFKNKRAQYYWMLRDRFFNTFRAISKNEYIDPDLMISISSDIKCIDQLRAEVCRIPKKDTGNGLIQIVSKEVMLSKHKIKSPNLADSLMMSMRPPSLTTWKGSKDTYDVSDYSHDNEGVDNWKTM